MRKSKIKLLLGIALLSGLAWACVPGGQADKELDAEVKVSVALPAQLAGNRPDAYNEVDWNENDKPVLLQLKDDQQFKTVFPESVNCNADGSARVDFVLDASQEEFRYWFCQAANVPVSSGSDHLDSWTLEIPDTQAPTIQGIDPSADVFTSSLSFQMPQEYMAANVWEPTITRKNAIAAISLSGIPKEYSLRSMVFQADEFIAGKQKYNILENGFVEGSELRNTITVNLVGEMQTYADAQGLRTIWLSMWPVTLDNFSIEVETMDPQGNAHAYKGHFEVFSPSIVLKEQSVTSWTVKMKTQSDLPVLPPTPEGPEGMIVGGKGATLDLFNKMKDYKDNGISEIVSWQTHQLGYQGVCIHEAKMIQYGQPIHMWVLEADPDQISFALGTPFNNNTVPPPSLQAVSEQAARAAMEDKKVIAAINGDAWGANGGLYTYGVMFKDAECLKQWAVVPNDISNTDTFYADDQGKVDIVDEDQFKKVLASRRVVTAIGGWYRLISQGGEPYAQHGAADGDPLLRDKSKTNGSLRNFLDRHPRTFMGITSDRVYLFAVDGRQAGWSVGLTLNGCARICYSVGCRRAINFDGGGSTTIVKRSGKDYKVLNKPSDGREREVVNSLLVVAR